MINEELREIISNEIGNDVIMLQNPSFDNSVVGIDEISGRVIYDLNLMIEELMHDENMSEEDAIDFISYDTCRAIPYFEESKRPIILNTYIKEIL